MPKQDEDNHAQDVRNARIQQANRRIEASLGKQIRAFSPDSLDDGNGFVASKFQDVLAAFEILKQSYLDMTFRMGCDVNAQGVLTYYPSSGTNRLELSTGTYAGRAYEYAARTMNLFKELKEHPEYWSGGAPPVEPSGSHLIVGEWAGRYAEATEEKVWPPKGLAELPVTGQYNPRVKTAIPGTVRVFAAEGLVTANPEQQ